ncbi:Ig-like domain-containing protein, partial [Bacillus thuringiensis]
VNAVKDTDTTVTGTTKAGADVIVKSGSTTLGTAKAESNGKYSVGIKPQKVGTTLSVTASNTAGLSEAATVVVTEEKPGKPIVNAVKDTDTTVTGTTKAGADV